MGEMITEALLEMHFHRAIVSFFEELFGARMFQLLKPSPQQEAWVGFDQGWSYTMLDSGQLFEQLKDAISSEVSKVDQFFLGYFFQYKMVKNCTRSSKNMPPHYHTPYFRVELSMRPNGRSGISQHETLLRLSKIKSAHVYYACPMFFDLDEIYSEPDLQQLRLVPLWSAPTGWATNTRHYIMFQEPEDTTPLWQSEPQEGVSHSFRSWATGETRPRLAPMSAEEVLTLLREASRIHFSGSANRQLKLIDDGFTGGRLPPSLTVIEFKAQDIGKEIGYPDHGRL